jgi:predicted nucleotidyltransferase component of viral defense system
MDRNSVFFKQAQLMMRIMPFVEKETCFALKGGTAINFFLRDMPRLSVDIDLTYLPIEGRVAGKRIAKLYCNNGDVQIKIEPNEVIRGSVFKSEERSVSGGVEAAFESSATMQVLSIADLYGGKLCAALDRQHPRDMFDVKLLLENEGITPDIRKAFIVYLVGHDRPIHELLDPKQKDMQEIYDREFVGMTTKVVSYKELTQAREQYISAIRVGLTSEERRFLVSVKESSPNWALLGLQGIEKLPSIQWKLANLAKMKPDKHAEYVKKLKRVLGED